MKTDIKTIANILACAIWADGVYEEAEKVVVEEIAETLGFGVDDLTKNVDAAVEAVNAMDEIQINEFLVTEAQKVDSTESEIVLETIMQLVISDNVLSVEETETIHTIATVLGVSQVITLMMFADMARTEPDLKIEF